MPAAATRVKLGVFTLLAIAGLVALALGLGVRARTTERVRYHTYFDESVHGLEVGAAVEYRGVAVGRVGSIRVAPDRVHVAVGLDVDRADAVALDLDRPSSRVRARLGLQGVTGLKYVDIDLVDPAVTPPIALGFAPGPRYLPAQRSMLEGVAAGLEAIGRRLPVVVEATVTGLGELERVLSQFRSEGLPAKVSAVLADVGAATGDLRRVLRGVDRAHLPARAVAVLDAAASALARADAALARLGGERGLLASAQRATDAVGDLGRGAGDSTAELERTVRDVGEAARALRDLIEAIDRDPDMLVKGRARRREP